MENMDTTEKEDEKQIMNMSWKRLETHLLTDGFRAGALAGKDNNFQMYFDRGYADGFQKSHHLGYKIGEQKIRLFVKQRDLQTISFERTLKNLCSICSEQKGEVS